MENRELMLRLIKYKRILLQLKSLGLQKVFSNNLGDAVSVSAALVRKDLSRICIAGNRRGGYSIDTMLSRLNELLGNDGLQDVILVGTGNLGKALLKHDFIKEGVRIVAAFDINPPREEINGLTAYPLEVLSRYVKEHKMMVGILCVPANAAIQVSEMMINAGMEGILNFAPIELKSTENCIISNVNIGLEIENLLFTINSARGTRIISQAGCSEADEV